MPDDRRPPLRLVDSAPAVVAEQRQAIRTIHETSDERLDRIAETMHRIRRELESLGARRDDIDRWMTDVWQMVGPSGG